MPSSSMTRVKVESADLQKVIPVATGASQARDFQTQDRSAVLEPHFSHQRLKPIPPNGRRARVSLILINDMNVLSCPSQAESTLHQVVLAHGTGRVVAHLHQRGLAYILSRDFVGLCKNLSHAGTTPSAISSIAMATSIVSSSARRSAWRRRATSSS